MHLLCFQQILRQIVIRPQMIGLLSATLPVAFVLLLTNTPAIGAESAAIAAVKAAHAEIIAPAPATGGKPIPGEPQRAGNATPDEVAVRIAMKLAELRARETAKKSDQKRARQEKTVPRAATPANTAETLGKGVAPREEANKYSFI